MSIATLPPLTSWMGRLSDTLKISQLSIPGTHDSCAVHDGGLFGFVHTQTESIDWQLKNGIRYLDIRCKRFPYPLDPDGSHPGILYIYHGIIYQQTTFGTILRKCFDFLSVNKKETILMRVQREGSDTDEAYKAAFLGYLDPNRFGRNKFWLGSSIPTLGEARGKIVLLTGRPWIDEGLDFFDMEIQDEYSNPQVADKKNKITDHMTNSKNSSGANLYVNHLSANGAGHSTWTPWSYAQIMNPFANTKILNQFSDSVQLGVIAYDYAGASTPTWNTHDNILAKTIIARNNFLPPPSRNIVTGQGLAATP